MKAQFAELFHQDYQQVFTIEDMLYQGKTAYQDIAFFQNAVFGRIMILDTVVQTTEKDEFIYHEMFAHVPILSHGSVKNVLIIGGGDGGLLREVCKHREISSITMVELDEQVIELSKKYLPNHSNGSFDDKRVNLIIGDGIDYVANCQQHFDLILSDSTDPIGPGEVLFSEHFYTSCLNCLTDDGILVTQNGVAALQVQSIAQSYQRLIKKFADVAAYRADVPTYVGGDMHFMWASQQTQHRQHSLSIIEKRYQASGIETHYYDPDLHLASFALPRYVKLAMQGELQLTENT
jgi:spermidine synthase